MPTAGIPTVRQGDNSGIVSGLQLALTARGFDPGPVDGVFGGGTASALRSFQSSSGLVSDGIAGPATWQRLEPQDFDDSERVAVIEMNFPFQFKTIPQWKTLFEAHNLRASRVVVLGFQPGFGLHIQVVIGLVQEQQIGHLQQDTSQIDQFLFATAEQSHWQIVLTGTKA